MVRSINRRTGLPVNCHRYLPTYRAARTGCRRWPSPTVMTGQDKETVFQARRPQFQRARKFFRQTVTSPEGMLPKAAITMRSERPRLAFSDESEHPCGPHFRQLSNQVQIFLSRAQHSDSSTSWHVFGSQIEGLFIVGDSILSRRELFSCGGKLLLMYHTYQLIVQVS